MGLHKLVCSEEELANKLELTNWAKDFSWDQVCTISQHMDAYTASRGTVIFDEGAEDNNMAIVIKGEGDITLDQAASFKLLNENAKTAPDKGLYKAFETTVTLRNMRNFTRGSV